MSKSVKGLMIKDFKLMKSQMKFFFILMFAWALFLAGNMEMIFFVGYIAVICSFLTLTTFSFDEVENGYSYLFTLPISKKDYVFEKYLFGVGLMIIPFVLIATLVWAVLQVSQAAEMSFAEYILNISSLLPAACICLVLEIPLQIQFGQQKSKVITSVMVGCMALCCGVIGQFNELAGTDGMEAVSSFLGLGAGTLAVITVGVLAVLFVLSYKISCKIIEKKEF